MRKDFILGLVTVTCLVLILIVYLVIRHEKTNKDGYQAAIGALRPSSPGEYNYIGGVPRGLAWV